MKHVEELQDDPGVRSCMAMPAQARGDGSEIGVTVAVEADELGVQYHAVPAQGLADGGELGELAGGVSAGARPQREPSAFEADLRADPVPFELQCPGHVRGGGKGGGARQHRRDEPGELLARHHQIKRTGVASMAWRCRTVR